MKYQGVYRTKVLEDITTYILHKRGIKDVYHYLNILMLVEELFNQFLEENIGKI